MLRQEYQRYTSDDHEVWRILFERQTQNLKGKAWSRYFDCLQLAGLDASAVPRFAALDENLLALTGWSIEVVKGIIPVREFIQLLHARRFCSSTWLRRRDQLDYLEEPDMFHDIYGHVPLLADAQYAQFIHRFAELGMKFINEPAALPLLDRFYWFTIEFGLLRENAELRIYGAGLISSFGETAHVFTDNVELRDFDVHAIMHTPFRNDQVQNLYFVLENMEQLWNSIGEAERVIRQALEAERFAEKLVSSV